jgi:hypothetical protein
VVLASQLYPITPIFELLVPPAWVKEAYPVLLQQVRMQGRSTSERA